jgi:hypothetical protein
LVIIAPDEMPVAKTWRRLASRFRCAQRTMDTIPTGSLSPLCVSAPGVETSKQTIGEVRVTDG